MALHAASLSTFPENYVSFSTENLPSWLEHIPYQAKALKDQSGVVAPVSGVLQVAEDITPSPVISSLVV